MMFAKMTRTRSVAANRPAIARLTGGALGALLVLGAGLPAIAASVAPAATEQATKQEERKRVVVLDFFYGDTSNPYWGSWSYSGRAAGVGISQKVVEALVQSGSVRVADRSQVADRDYGEVSVAEAVEIGKEIGVDYVIIGTVTEFNVDERSAGGSFMGIGGSSNETTASVELSIRVIDTATGDIVTTARGEGEESSSSGGGSFRGISGRSGSSDDEGLMSEAVEEAVEDLVENLVEKL